MDDQNWFWTPEWQAMEAEADKEFAEGNYLVFDDMDEFLAELEMWQSLSDEALAMFEWEPEHE